MSIHRERTKVSAVDCVAQKWARELENAESERSGTKVSIARLAVARRVGVPAGTLENMRRGRLKGVRLWVFDRLRTAVMREIEAEIRRLEHELEIARNSGFGVGEADVQEIRAGIQALREKVKG